MISVYYSASRDPAKADQQLKELIEEVPWILCNTGCRYKFHCRIDNNLSIDEEPKLNIYSIVQEPLTFLIAVLHNPIPINEITGMCYLSSS